MIEAKAVMRIRRLLILATLITGCGVNAADDTQEVIPGDDFVRLSFIACSETVEDLHITSVTDQDGKEDTNFAYERVTEDSDYVNKLSLLISDGVKAMSSYSSEFTNDPSPYTGLYMEPLEESSTCAEFQTVRFYSQKDLADAVMCYAVSGGDVIRESESLYSFDFEMPATFMQTRNQDPSFLNDCVYMYATAQFEDNKTFLNFNHIPAYFRFIIDNGSSTSVVLQSVSIFVSDQTENEKQAIASSNTTVSFDLSENNTDLSYDTVGHDKVMTILDGDDRILGGGGRYTAYLMALPIGNDGAFRNKMLNFQVQTGDSQIITYQLSGDKFAERNTGVSDWVGGKSYTVQISIGRDAEVTGKMTSDNTIEVYSDASGPYTLKYVDTDGRPLEEYADICSLTVDDIAVYEDFIDANVAPDEAFAIGVFDSEIKCLSTISIPRGESDRTEPIYTFGLLSDIHLTPENTVQGQDKFKRALAFFNEKRVDFINICGDISETGTAAEYAIYNEMVNSYSPTIPVYTTTGNHDAGNGINHADWKEYTGHEVVFDFSRTLPDGTADHFLFLGMSYWSPAYVEEYMTWLENKLFEYKDERCFIITHLFFPDMAGNVNGIYPPANCLSGKSHDRLKLMCENNLNTVWFSGHSHWRWALQQYDKKANVCRLYEDDKPVSGWTVHVPSCARPIDSNGEPGSSGARVDRINDSEGAIVKVYADHIDIQGLDLINLKYLPIATYRLNTDF